MGSCQVVPLHKTYARLIWGHLSGEPTPHDISFHLMVLEPPDPAVSWGLICVTPLTKLFKVGGGASKQNFIRGFNTKL